MKLVPGSGLLVSGCLAFAGLKTQNSNSEPETRNQIKMRILIPCLFAIATLVGCDLLGKSGPEEVRLEIQGEPGQEVRLITSSFFLTSRIQDVRDDGSAIDSLAILLFDADTSVITFPFNEIYDIRSDQQFYVRVNRFAPDSDNLEMRMWVDDDLKFEREATPDRDSLQFIYNFRGAPGQDNVEL